jgi:peroxiredoxin
MRSLIKYISVKIVWRTMRADVKTLLLISLITLFSCVSVVTGLRNAPDFTLTDIYGNPFSLSSCPAKVVLMDFFGTTCPPCEVEVLTLRSLYIEYSRGDLGIISISPESEDALRTFAQQHGMEWIVAKDTAGVVDAYLGLDTRIPHTFLVANGSIRYDLLGWSVERGDPSNLRSKIDSLLLGGDNGDSNGNSNGDSNGDSDTGQTGPPYTLIAIIGGAVIVFLVVGIVVAGQLLGWSEPAKKRRSRKRKR